MKKSIILSVILIFSTSLFAQKFITKSGHIRFYSETPLETIEANNKQVNAAYDHDSGHFVFKVLMKSFEFEKALMQEHFNENYVESDDFPNATFKGMIVDHSDLILEEENEVQVKVKGQMTIHGVTQEMEVDGLFDIQENQIHAISTFSLKPADFDIKIPGAVVKNIAEEIEVTVDILLNELSK